MNLSFAFNFACLSYTQGTTLNARNKNINSKSYDVNLRLNP